MEVTRGKTQLKECCHHPKGVVGRTTSQSALQKHVGLWHLSALGQPRKNESVWMVKVYHHVRGVLRVAV